MWFNLQIVDLAVHLVLCRCGIRHSEDFLNAQDELVTFRQVLGADLVVSVSHLQEKFLCAENVFAVYVDSVLFHAPAARIPGEPWAPFR